MCCTMSSSLALPLAVIPEACFSLMMRACLDSVPSWRSKSSVSRIRKVTELKQASAQQLELAGYRAYWRSPFMPPIGHNP